MFADFFGDWAGDPADWASQAWRTVVDFAQAASDGISEGLDGISAGLSEAAGVVIGLVVLYFLLPILAHLAALLLLWHLGAPAWLVAALLFGQVH